MMRNRIGLIIGALLLLMTGNGWGQELIASYYSVESLKKEGTYEYSHGIMANGGIFKDDRNTSACNSYPLGAILRVVSRKTGRSVVVVNTDRTARRFKGKRIDLSIQAMREIDGIKSGLVEVVVERIDK